MKRTLLSLCLTFITVLALHADNFNLLEVDFENGLPEGWTQEYVKLPMTQSANEAWYSWSVESGDSLTYPNGCVSGTHRAKAANTTNQEMRFVTRLISPPLNLNNVFRPQLLFWHAEPARASFCDTLRLYYRTGPTEVWRPLKDTAYTHNNRWKQEEITLIRGVSNTAYQVAFEISESMGRGVVLDDIIFRPTPTCKDVQNIVFSNVHAYDAVASWVPVGAYDHFQVIVADTLLDMQNIDQSRVVASFLNDVYDPVVEISGLNPETTYYVYVRSDCAETNGYTNWVMASFKTLKVAYLPYAEDFNSSVAIAGNASYGQPDGWTMGNNLQTTVPFVIRNATRAAYSPYSIDSTAYLGFVGSVGTTPTAIPATKYVYAVTPEIVDTLHPGASLQGLQVRFWLTAADFVSLGTQMYASSLMVGTMSDPLDYMTFHPLDTIHIDGTSLFRPVTMNLDNYIGTDKFIALACRASVANAMFVDNFTMSMPAAPVPDEVVLSNITSTGFTVKPSLHDASSWDMVVSTEYSRTGEVSAESVVLSQNALTASSFVVNVDTLADHIVHVYTRTHKGSAISEWSFARTIRVPGKMPVLTDDAGSTFALNFENGNRLAINQLDQEARLGSSFQGLSEVYYPLGAVSSSINTFPKCVTTAPNYNGAHLQICGADSWFVLPEATDVNTLKMVFRHATLNGKLGKIAVGVMTDPYDLATFVQLASFEADATEYVRRLVSFDSYTGSGKYIAFRSLNAGSGTEASVNLLDAIIVSKLGTCREASNVSVEAHASHATVTWNGGGMDSWIVGLATDRYMMTATYDTVTQPQITFNNLEQLQKYYFTIQTVCNGEPLDLDNVCYNFTTPRGLPFTEYFQTTSLPTGWKYATTRASSVFSGTEMSLTSTGSSSRWQIGGSSSYVHDPLTGNVAYFTMTSSSNYGWLLSPELFVDADPDKPLELVFDLGMASYTYSGTTGEAALNDQFMVVVSEDGGNTWLRSNATVWNNTGDGDYVLNNLIWDGGERVAIDFSKYIGKRIKIGFYVEATSSTFKNYLCVDNIILRIGDDRCGGLRQLSAHILNTSTAQATWQLHGTNPYPALVQLATSATFANKLVDDTIQGTSTVFNNLQPNTKYYVRARQLCDNDNEWQNITFRTPCMAISPEAFGTESFDDADNFGCWTVGFNAVDAGTDGLPQQKTLANFGGVLDMSKTSVTATDGAYAVTPEFAFENGDDISHYQVVFRAGTTAKDTTNAGFLKVGIVIDPNDMSATFSPIAEINLQYAADSTELKTYVVSFENYLGDLVLEEKGNYVVFISEAGANHTNYVLIDDVTIAPVEACHMVIDMEADSTTVDGGHLTWTGNGVRYEIGVMDKRVLPDTCTTWLFHQVVDTTVCQVSGLEATTVHFAYVRAFCADGDTSRWSSATMFQTERGVPFIETFDGELSLADRGFHGLSSSTHFPGDSIVVTVSKSNQWSKVAVPGIVSGMEGNAVRMNIYSDWSYWLISPDFDLSTVSTGVQFSAKVALTAYSSSGSGEPAASTDDRLGVLVSRNGGKTWYKRDATFWSSDGTGDHLYDFGLEAKRIEVDMSDYVGDTITIAVLGESTKSGSDNYLYVDSIRITKLSSECLGVRNATFELSGGTSAVARWRIFGTPNDVVCELSDEADFGTILMTDTTALDSIEYTDLLPSHTYYVRLSQLGCSSAKIATAQVKTLEVIPFSELFNAGEKPLAWSLLQGDADAAVAGTSLPVASTSKTAWDFTKNFGLSGNHLSGMFARTAALTDQWIVSPDIFIPASSESVKLSFDAAITKYNSGTALTSFANMEFRVLVSTDQGASWSDHQWIFREDDNAFMKLSEISAAGKTIYIPMDDFIGEQIRFAFYKKASGSANGMLHIGKVQLRELEEPCDAPTNLSASDVAVSSATINWQGEEDKTYIVEYSLQADFTNAKRDTVFDALTHTLTGLRSGTIYFVRVQTMCTAKSLSDYTEAISFETAIGVPYVNSLSSLNGWTRYESPIEAGLTGERTAPLAENAGWKESSYAAILDTAHIYCSNGSSTAYWLVSPSFDLTDQEEDAIILLTVDLSLTKASTSADAPVATDYQTENKFYIAVSTDGGETYLPANAWEFSAAETAQYSYADIPAGKGNTYRFDFSRFVGQTIRIALVSMATKPAAINAARLTLEHTNSLCFGLSKIAFGVADTAVLCTVTPMDNSARWELAYGLHGKKMKDMLRVETTTLTTRLGGLMLDTIYDVYGRSICGEGDSSIWIGPYSFETPLGLTYEAPFSNSLDGWKRYNGLPDSVFAGVDTLTATASGWTTTQSTSQALSQPHIYCTASTAGASWLVSPEINLMPQDGTKGIWLSFKAALTSSYNSKYGPTNAAGHKFYVAVSEDNGQTWTKEHTVLWADSITGDEVYTKIPDGDGKTYHLDFREYAGKKICIALIEDKIGSGASCIHIADLELAEYEVPCFGVENFTATVDGNLAHCTITDPSTSSTAWQYTYGRSGFTPSVAVATVTNREFDIPNLPMSSTVDIYVRSLCGSSDTSAWFGPKSVKTPVGIPFEESFNTTTMPSGWTGASGWSVGSRNIWGVPHAYVDNYDDETRMLVSPEISIVNVYSRIDLSFDLALTKWSQSGAPTDTQGQSFEVVVSTDHGASFNTVAVWGENASDDYIYASIPTTGERYHVDLSEYVDNSIVIGFKAISTVPYSYSSGSPDNDIHIKNVVLDTVSGGITYECSPVSSMSVLDTTYHTATVIFRGKSVADALALEYICLPKSDLFNLAAAVRTDTNVVNVKNLDSSNEYNMWARIQCDSATWSPWAGPFPFHTVECRPVSDVSLMEVTADGIVLKAVSSSKAYAYQACVVPEGEPYQVEQAQTFRSDTIHMEMQMAANSIYDVYVRKICEIGDTSTWAGPFAVHSPRGVPFVEKLSGTTSLPDGWVSTSVNSYYQWQMGRSSSVWGVSHAYVNNDASGDGYFILLSPQIITSDAKDFLDLSFDLALTGYNTATAPTSTKASGQTFEIRISTDGGNTFESPIEVWSASSPAGHRYTDIPAEGARYHVDLSPYIGRSINVGFYASSGDSGDTDLHLKNVRIDTTALECKGVKNIQVVDVSTTKATVTYEFENEESKTAYLEVATDREFEQLVVAETLTDQMSYALDNLVASTTYFVRLRTDCDFGSSDWSATVAFTTAYGIRYTEDFNEESRFAQWTYSGTPSADVFATNTLTESTSSSAGELRWTRCTTKHQTVFPTSHLQCDIWSSDSRQWIISPVIDLTENAGDGLLLSLDIALCDYYNDGGTPTASIDHALYLVVSEDGGQTWKQRNSFSWRNTGKGGTFNYDELGVTPKNYILDMTKFGGKTIKLGFCAEAMVSGGDNYIMIDNIDLNKAIMLEYNDTICEFEDYDEHGFSYRASDLQLGMNTFQIVSQNFDTVTHLSIYVNPLPTVILTDTICEGEVYNDYGFDPFVAEMSGEHRLYIERAQGCDSIVTLNLTVLPKLYAEVYDTLCDGSVFEFKGKKYYHDVIVKDTLSTALTGCDSIVTYYITFSANAVAESDIYAIICEGQYYRDELFYENQTGVYKETTSSVAGCDSIVTLHLTVLEGDGVIYDTVSVDDLPYYYEGEELIPAGSPAKDYVFPLESTSEDCSPELHVHVWQKTGLESAQSLQLSVAPNPVQVGEPLYILTDIHAGADFTATVYNAIGQEVYTVSEFTTELPAINTSGIYMVRVLSGKKLYEGKIIVK